MDAGDALFALDPEELLEPRGAGVDEIAEHVDLTPVHVAVDLKSGHDLERRVEGRLGEGLPEPLGRVVIRHRQHAHAVPDGEAHELSGTQRPVGGRRVRVEVDAR